MDTLIGRKYRHFSPHKVLSKDWNQFQFVDFALCPFTDRIFLTTRQKSLVVLSPTGEFLYSIKQGSFYPWSVCFIGGIICMIEYDNQSIVFITAEGNILTRSSSLDVSLLANAPNSITTYLGTDIFICDCVNHRIISLSSCLPFYRTVGDTKLLNPLHVETHDDRIFVLDLKSPCVAIFSFSGEIISRIYTCGLRSDDVCNPSCFTIDIDENFIFTEFGSYSIRVISFTGQLLNKFGRSGNGKGEFESIIGVAINSASQIVTVCRRYKNCIQIF